MPPKFDPGALYSKNGRFPEPFVGCRIFIVHFETVPGFSDFAGFADIFGPLADTT